MKISNLLKVPLIAGSIISANAYADYNTERAAIAARCSGVYAAIAAYAQQTNNTTMFNDSRRRGILYLDASYAYLPQAQANQLAKETADTTTKSLLGGRMNDVVKIIQLCDNWAKNQGK